jgi:hypothetical protein
MSKGVSRPAKAGWPYRHRDGLHQAYQCCTYSIFEPQFIAYAQLSGVEPFSSKNLIMDKNINFNMLYESFPCLHNGIKPAIAVFAK